MVKSDETKESLPESDLLNNSSLYKAFLAEREEVLKQEWIESKKAGRDIGFEWALADWTIKHRSKWRNNQQVVEAGTTTISTGRLDAQDVSIRP